MGSIVTIQPNSRRRRPTRLLGRSLLVSAIIGLLLLSGGLSVLAYPSPAVGWQNGSTSSEAIAFSYASTPGTVSSSAITLGGVVALTPSTFWSVDAQTKCATCIHTNATVDTFLSQTPFTWVRYGEGSDACNDTTNTAYSASGTASVGCAYSVPALQSWCRSLTTPCHSILSLPGENNNSLEDAAIAKYIVQTLSFQPDFWSIGNEPTGWTHYGIPWVDWSSTDASTVSPMAYAFDVKAGIAAVLQVDPSAKFIGLEAACSCNTAWFQDVAAVDGSAISAIAYHSYPSDGSATPTLSEFYQPLSSSRNLTASYSTVRSDISSRCTPCATLPIFVNEYNAGPGAAPSSLAGTYANALFLAASVVQGLRANVSQLTVYNLQTGVSPNFGYALMNGAGTVGPTGTLFAQVLSHLAIGSVYGGGVLSGLSGVWSVVSRNSSSESLLLVDTNLTVGVNVSTGTSFFASLSGTSYAWSPSQGSPNATAGIVQAGYAVPPQGMLLLTVALPAARSGNGNSTEYPVNVTESGLPAGTPWWASFAAHLASSTSPAIGFTATNGSYGFRVGAAGYSALGGARTANVSGGAINIGIDFVAAVTSTFGLTFTEFGLPPGTLWSVIVDGVPQSTTTSSLALTVQAGTHSFTVGGISRYLAEPANGTVIVAATSGNGPIDPGPVPGGVAGSSGISGPAPTTSVWVLGATGFVIATAALCALAHRARRRPV
jgi:hypothetical protein